MKIYDETQNENKEYIVNFLWDDEAEVWIAVCDDIPLTLESESLDELINRVRLAASEIIKMNNLPKFENVCLSMNRHEKLEFA